MVEKAREMEQYFDGLRPSPEEAGVLREVLRAVRDIRYGHVQIIIQDAKVVQIDRTEKVRLNQS